MTSDEQRGAEYWARRADEARCIAEQMKDAHARDSMLRIAERYDAMAQRAAKKQAS